MGQADLRGHRIPCTEKDTRHICGPAKGAPPRRNHEEASGKSKLGDILQNTWPDYFENIETMKDQEKSCLRIKENKETGPVCDLGSRATPPPACGGGRPWDSCGNLMMSAH